MMQMRDKDTVSKGPKRRDEAAHQVTWDIVIPAGTILRQEPGKPGTFKCAVGGGGEFVFTPEPGKAYSNFKPVVA